MSALRWYCKVALMAFVGTRDFTLTECQRLTNKATYKQWQELIRDIGGEA